MLNAIAAGVAGIALAVSSAIIPVKDLGANSDGWFKGGRYPNSYSVTFNEDTVELTSKRGEFVEMELARFIDVYDLDRLVTPNGKLNGDLEAEGAVVKFPYAFVSRDGGEWGAPNTSIVFHPAGSSDAPGEAMVQLTWYGANHDWMPLDQFVEQVERGHLTGLVGGQVTVGMTNSIEENEWTSVIDSVTLGDTTWDFGRGKVEPGHPIEGTPENPVPPTADKPIEGTPENPIGGEPPAQPAHPIQDPKDNCKDGGWKDLTDAAGNNFKNQGQCVAYFSH
jgi:hypothetical protein